MVSSIVLSFVLGVVKTEIVLYFIISFIVTVFDYMITFYKIVPLILLGSLAPLLALRKQLAI